MNLLAIDIGNTHIHLGIFRDKKLLKTRKVLTKRHRSYGPLIRQFIKRNRCKNTKRINAVIVSCVVPKALKSLRPLLSGYFGKEIFVVGETVRAPIENLYEKPRQVGQDRLANAVAAKAIYGSPAIVIDFGTAITFDCLSRRGAYLGGLILPGIDLSFQGLYERMALLPRVGLYPTKHIIGKNTVESMRSGILFGYGALCDGLVEKLKKILGKDTRVITTGGSCKLLKDYARSIKLIDENLTLKGLMIIFDSIS